MPLCDHFRPPLSRTSSDQEVQGQWPAVLVQQLGRFLINHEAVITNDWTGLGDKTGDELDAAIEKALAATEPSEPQDDPESEIMLSQ